MPVGKLAKAWHDHKIGTAVVTPDVDVTVEEAFGPSGFVVVPPVRFEYLQDRGFLAPMPTAPPMEEQVPASPAGLPLRTSPSPEIPPPEWPLMPDEELAMDLGEEEERHGG